MRLPNFFVFLICLNSLWKSTNPATLRLLKAAYGKETVHDSIIDPRRYAAMNDELAPDEQEWAELCGDADKMTPIFSSLLCPLQYILIAEYRNKNAKFYPSVDAALESITSAKVHLCSHLPVHSPLGIADQEGRIIKTQSDVDTASCIAMQTHEKKLVYGCALGVTDERSHFHVLPATDEKTIKEMDLSDISTKSIAPLRKETKGCILYTFTYGNQPVIQDRVCCWTERCVTIYYDQPGSDPWPLIRHVVAPEWVGFKCEPEETSQRPSLPPPSPPEPGPRSRPEALGYKIVENRVFDVKAEPFDEDPWFPVTLGLIGFGFVLVILVMFAGFFVYLRLSSEG
ncbi:unnamed protein product, partial [Mesorhabditis belari]|uniref:Uncharacterized protein n=1 Tax=Mesorhabditis belari TaxID=2138241 RepID=A0AAF3EJB1_9BILA